jgi:hypothetical protein
VVGWLQPLPLPLLCRCKGNVEGKVAAAAASFIFGGTKNVFRKHCLSLSARSAFVPCRLFLQRWMMWRHKLQPSKALGPLPVGVAVHTAVNPFTQHVMADHRHSVMLSLNILCRIILFTLSSTRSNPELQMQVLVAFFSKSMVAAQTASKLS